MRLLSSKLVSPTFWPDSLFSITIALKEAMGEPRTERDHRSQEQRSSSEHSSVLAPLRPLAFLFRNRLLRPLPPRAAQVFRQSANLSERREGQRVSRDTTPSHRIRFAQRPHRQATRRENPRPGG